MHLRTFMFALATIVLLVGFGGASAVAAEYKYITAEETAKAIHDNVSIAIIDIQLKDGFDTEHLKNAIATYAFPVKTDEQKKMLDEALGKTKDDATIIIVCPRGGGGAKNTIDHYVKNGVSNDRLYILKNGQEGWPRKSLSDVLVK